jgi:hypothetical protein
MKEELILKLIQIQNQIRFLHWQTNSESRHRAYGKTYDDIGQHIDDFAEALMGKYGKFDFNSEFTISFQDIKSISVGDFIEGVIEFLTSLTDYLDPVYDSDLLNLKDEILLIINKLNYLLTLKP